MATQALFDLIITKVDGPLFRGEALSVTVPGGEGALTVLAHHEPFISLLKKGTISVKRGNTETEEFSIEQGILEVSHNQATILV